MLRLHVDRVSGRSRSSRELPPTVLVELTLDPDRRLAHN